MSGSLVVKEEGITYELDYHLLVGGGIQLQLQRQT